MPAVLLRPSLESGEEAAAVDLAREEELDRALQREALRALGGRDGTVIVMDAGTGRVRALVNSRVAFAEAHTPGSAVKPFTMLAALRDGLLKSESRILCRERYRRGDYTTRCSHKRLKEPFGPAQALAYSCNYYFAKLSERMKDGELTGTLASFGFGASTGADKQEAQGMLPRGYWRTEMALGDDPQLLVTPVQLITAYAALFNGGHLFTPRAAQLRGFVPRERGHISLLPEHRAQLLDGMRGVILYGTAAPAQLNTSARTFIFGKTGTASSVEDFHPHGWFIALASERENARAIAGQEENALDAQENVAPPASVRLAVLVFLKRAHGAECATVARPVLEEYARWLARSFDSSEEAVTQAQRFAGSSTLNSSTSSSPPDFSPASPSSSTASPAIYSSSFQPVRVRMLGSRRTRTLSLDDYLFGVLAAEGSTESRFEALKAQAVISRTYALKNERRHSREGFDFCDSTHCQRYLAVSREPARAEFYELLHRAVAETAGEVLLEEPQGELADAYFSASCGGMTANIGALWGTAYAPVYLRGLRDEYCEGQPRSHWTDTIPAASLLRALDGDRRTAIGAKLWDIRVVVRDETGRAQLLSLEGERGRLVSGWDFKLIVGRALGWNLLKSTRFEVTRAGSAFVFQGSGFGHGLGLCQSGAHVMAERGASYRQILDHYFPGTRLARIP